MSRGKKQTNQQCVHFQTSLIFPELSESQRSCSYRVPSPGRSLKVLWVQVALAADNVTGASPTLAPAQIGVTCRCPNGAVASEDGPDVTLNYWAECLQQDGGDAAARGRRARTSPPHRKRKKPYGIRGGRGRGCHILTRWKGVIRNTTFCFLFFVTIVAVVFQCDWYSYGPASKFRLLEERGMSSPAFHPIRR